MTLLLCLLIFLPKILLGFATAHLLWKDLTFPAMLLKLSIGVPLGLALSASAFFIAALAGVSPAIYSRIEFWGILVIVLLFLLNRFILQRETVDFKGFSRQGSLGAVIVLAGALLSISAFLYYAKMHPYGFEDAWSVWNFPARVIFRENSADILLNTRLYNRFHPDYPVELSLNVAWGWFIQGNEIPRIPIAISLLATFTPPAIVWATLGKWKDGLAGALAALLIVLSANFPSAVGQYADPLFTLHLLAAAALFYGYLKSQENGLMILAGLLAGFSAWVKNEGFLFIGVFSIVCSIAAWRKTIRWGAFKWLTAGVIVPIMVVVLFKSLVESENDILGATVSMTDQILDFSRWILIGKSFIAYFTEVGYWPVSIVLVLIVYAAFMGFDARETPYQILLAFIFLGQIAGYYFIYLITPHSLEMHIYTSMQRLVFHVFPILLLWLFAALRSPELTPNGQAVGGDGVNV